jgi:hypothetical protein
MKLKKHSRWDIAKKAIGKEKTIEKNAVEKNTHLRRVYLIGKMQLKECGWEEKNSCDKEEECFWEGKYALKKLH